MFKRIVLMAVATASLSMPAAWAGPIADRLIASGDDPLRVADKERVISFMPRPQPVDSSGSCQKTKVRFESEAAKLKAGWMGLSYEYQLNDWAVGHWGDRAGRQRASWCRDGEFAARAWQAALGEPPTGVLTASQMARLVNVVDKHDEYHRRNKERQALVRRDKGLEAIEESPNSSSEQNLELTTLTPKTSLEEFKSLKVPASCKWGKQDVHFYCLTNVAYAGHVPKEGAAIYFFEGRLSRIDVSAGLALAPKIRAELDLRYGAHTAETTTHAGPPLTTYNYQSGGTVLVPGPNGGFSEALAPAIAVPSGSVPTTYNRTTYRWKAPCINATSSDGFATIAFVPCR